MFRGVQGNLMTSKLVRFFAPIVFALSVTALAQTDSSAAALPAAPSATAAAPAPTVGTGTKIATINIEQAIFASNEGQREFETLSKKLEPKQTELKGINDELESLKKQLNVQEGKLSEEARNNLVNQFLTVTCRTPATMRRPSRTRSRRKFCRRWLRCS
jgi:Skp family chaperone for outer membrane proteins